MARPKGSKNKKNVTLPDDSNLDPDKAIGKQQDRRKTKKSEAEKVENALNKIRKMMGHRRSKTPVTKSSDNYDVGYTFAEPLSNRMTSKELVNKAYELDPNRRTDLWKRTRNK